MRCRGQDGTGCGRNGTKFDVRVFAIASAGTGARRRARRAAAGDQGRYRQASGRSMAFHRNDRPAPRHFATLCPQAVSGRPDDVLRFRPVATTGAIVATAARSIARNRGDRIDRSRLRLQRPVLPSTGCFAADMASHRRIGVMESGYPTDFRDGDRLKHLAEKWAAQQPSEGCFQPERTSESTRSMGERQLSASLQSVLNQAGSVILVFVDPYDLAFRPSR